MSESGNNRGDERGVVVTLFSWLQQRVDDLRQKMLERRSYGKQRRMVLLEALHLGNRRQLFLVSCDEHRFLVGAGSDRIGTLIAFPGTTSGEGLSVASAEAALRAATQRSDVLRSSGGKPGGAWMRGAIARTAGSRLELVPRESVSTCDAQARGGLETGRTQ